MFILKFKNIIGRSNLIRYERLSNLFKCVFYICKEDMSILKFEKLINLIKSCQFSNLTEFYVPSIFNPQLKLHVETK